MSIFEKQRFEIFNAQQHPYRHTLAEFAFTNPATPGATNVEAALNWILAVLYPQTKPSVANPAALPLVGNTINDYRVVLDDGDGKAASYRWEQREGEVAPSWHKIYDMDWGADSILEQFLTKTQDLFVFRNGYDDIDSAGVPVVGLYAGQTIYGGKSASTNLTLKANSGDGVGAQTGFVQVDDHFRPAIHNTWDAGTTAIRFRTGYFGTSVVSGTLTAASGSITDTSGAISFADENLTTTGTITSGTLTIAAGSITDTSGAISFANENLTTTGTITANSMTATGAPSSFASGTTIGDLTLANGSITSSSGAITFDNENLSTTGTLSAGNITGTRLDIDATTRIDANTISILTLNTALNLVANGTGVIDLQSAATTLGITATGNIDASGFVEGGNLRLTGNTLQSSSGNITIDPSGSSVEFDGHLIQTSTNTFDLGATSALWRTLYIGTSIATATQSILSGEVMSLRNNLFRNAARTLAVANGDTLFWDSVSGTWLANHPDTEIDHGELSGLLDDDHTQYALLAGRAGGQSLIGGTAASNNLTFESTSNASKGFIIFKDVLRPNVDDTTDIGNATFRFQDLFMSGQGIGFRVQNFANFAAFDAASAANTGRLGYDVAEKDVYLDSGGTWFKISAEKYTTTDAVGWDGVATSVAYVTSASITDARFAIWRMYDNTNTYAELFPQITKSAAGITVSFDSPPPSGTYTIVGLG